MQSSKTITIVCDGGLGNRFGSLFPASCIAFDFGLDYNVSWPVNNWCGCDFSDIFAPIHKFQDLTISDIAKNHPNDLFVIHENQTGVPLKNILPHAESTLLHIKNSRINVVYYHNKIPSYISTEKIISAMKRFPIAESIRKRVQRFCKDHNVGKNVKGIHIRKTDHPSQIDDSAVFLSIKNDPNNRYFLCSDDKNTEEKFSRLGNVIVHQKDHYVDKLVQGTWRETITDSEGRSFNFNVNRSRDSVIDGFVDMLILSRTNIAVKNNKSTFLEFAKLYQHLDI